MRALDFTPFPRAIASSSPVRSIKTYDLESRLTGLREVNRLLRPGAVNRLFEALEAYVGPIAGDVSFSRRMTAVQHTVWLMESLDRLSHAISPGEAHRLFANRGIEGLTKCTLITQLSHLYHHIPETYKKALWLAAILHDIGKATGNRERHQSPEIALALRAALKPYLTEEQTGIALKLIEAVIGEHDMIGGLAITRDRNIFECAEAIRLAGADQKTRDIMLTFLTLINFADIDGQSEWGIFTDDNIQSFCETSKSVREFTRYDRLENDLAWWGRQRCLAWVRGDNQQITHNMISEIINYALPNQEAIETFFAELGRLSLFDGMYNLGTAIADPVSAVRCLIWIAHFAKTHGITTITFDDNSFLTNPAAGNNIRHAATTNDFAEIFNLDVAEHSSRTLRLTLKPLSVIL
jgi:hypothetical protein